MAAGSVVYRPPCRSLLRYALAHGLTLNWDGICIVDDPVTDGVSQGWGVQVLVPLAGVVLGAKDSRGRLVSGLYQFQRIPCLCLLEGVEHPLVQDEQLLFLKLFHVVSVSAVGPHRGDFHQQIRQADILDSVEVTVGIHAKGAGQVGLTTSPGSPPRQMILWASWR